DKEKNLYISHTTLQYLYARSFFKEIPFVDEIENSFNAWLGEAEKQWLQQNLQGQARLASALQRYGKTETAMDIVNSLRERSSNNDTYGMYWKELNNSYYWYESPIETQALLIETFEAIDAKSTETDAMRTWLINQK